MRYLAANAYDRLVKKALDVVSILPNAFYLAEPRRCSDLMSEVARLRSSLANHSHAQCGAYYAPGIRSSSGDPEPLSGIIAAKVEETDNTRGIWKAPANVTISGFGTLEQSLSPTEVSTLVGNSTEPSVNPIVHWGQTNKIWGARALSTDRDDRYIPVVRFSNWIRASVEVYLDRQRGRSNDALLWGRVERSVENYLNELYRSGALQGVKPESAYFVSVGQAKTMTTQDVQEGRLIVEMDLAMLKPAEFQVLRLVQEQ